MEVENATVMASFGAGVNSAALLVGWVQRGLPLHAVLFADTGGERPSTYAFRDTFSDWLVAHGYPAVLTVRKVRATGEIDTLEQQSLLTGTLPSLAYGWKSCSQRYKKAPQDKWTNNWDVAKDTWARGERVVKLIGFDADEPHRAARLSADAKYLYHYPLLDWNWGRAECLAALAEAGVVPAGKSACFFCPANTLHEILKLEREYPDLMQRALAIEDAAAANLTSVKGLGRRFNWRQFIEGQRLQGDLFAPQPGTPESGIDLDCGCYDGGDE